MIEARSVSKILEEAGSGSNVWKPARLVLPPLQQERAEEHAFLQNISLRLWDANVEEEVTLQGLDFNALATTEMLHTDCEVEYTGPSDDDVVLKVFKGSDPRHLSSYVYVGHAHAMQADNRTIRVRSGGGSYYLGLELVRGLNKKISPEAHKKRENLAHGFLGLALPEESDFLVVFGSRDSGENTTWLRHLDTTGPRRGPWEETVSKHGGIDLQTITFCTDLSIGLGQHFGSTIDLHLGRRSFGLEPPSTDPGAWFQELGEVSRLTRYGVLLVTVRPEAFQSRACDMELFAIEHHRRFVYLHQEERIAPASEYRRTVERDPHPIIKASLEGNFSEIVEALRDDVRYSTLAVDKRGHSSLAMAAEKGMSNAVREIMHCRADVDGKCYLGVSPLHYAAAHGHVEVAQRLLQCGATVNSKDDSLGYTPLHEAARVGRAAVVEFLLEARADKWLKDKKEQTAFDLAMLEGHLSIANLIKDHVITEASSELKQELSCEG